MSLTPKDVLEIKTMLKQVVQNQTVMMSHLIGMAKKEGGSIHPQQLGMVAQALQNYNNSIKSRTPGTSTSAKGMAIKSEPRSPNNSAANALMMKSMSTPAASKRKIELPLENIGNGGSRSRPQPVNRENGPPAAKRNVKPLPAHERYCSICEDGVKVDQLVEHIWDHIKKKVASQKGSMQTQANVYSYVCDIKDCNFRTNKFQEATGHAQKAHPDSTSHKVIVDNTENTTEVFKLVLAQCYDTLEDADKDMIYKRRFH